MESRVQGEMTIQELAARTGMTVRNIRAHQTRGLLPPPVVRGRTGYYNEEHIARIELTREMQAEGLNLEAIRRVLETGGDGATAMFDFTRALRASFEEEETPEILDAQEVASIWGGAASGEDQRRAEELDIFHMLPDGRFEVTSPRLFNAAAELAQLGVGPSAALDTAERLRHHADGAARTFVELFIEEIWAPFDKAGRPQQDWQRLSEALERLRPLAAGAVLAAFQIAMAEEVEKESARTLRPAGEEPEQTSVSRRPPLRSVGP